MKKVQILIISIILILIAMALFLMLTGLVQGESSRNYHTYTKAVCDDKNFCQDYEIVCENDSVTSMNPITGASIQQPANWQDPRANKSEISCD